MREKESESLKKNHNSAPIDRKGGSWVVVDGLPPKLFNIRDITRLIY